MNDHQQKTIEPSKLDNFTPDIIRRYHGCEITREKKTHQTSMIDMFSETNSFDHVGEVAESLTRHVYKRCHASFHFSTDESEEGPRHSRKFGELQRRYCERWQSMVLPGRDLCMDESRVPGWYHSAMTLGPDPKPVRTGSTAHTICVGQGPLMRFLMAWRTYGGRTDEGLASLDTGKWIQLFDTMVKPWIGKGHVVTLDSAYNSEKLIDQARVKGVNVVRTFMWDRFGASSNNGRVLTTAELHAGLTNTPFDMDFLKKTLKIRTHETMFAQREDCKMTLCVWADNGFVRVATNMLDVEVAPDSVLRRTIGSDGKRNADATLVDAPISIAQYQKTYNKIDQFNKEALKDNLFSKSMHHNWAPKISFALYSCGIENAYLVYKAVGGKDDRRTCKINLAQHLLAAGPAVRKTPPIHPAFTPPKAPSLEKRVSQPTDRLGSESPAASATPAVVNMSPPASDVSPRKRRGLESKTAQAAGHVWRKHQTVFDDSYVNQGHCGFANCPRRIKKQGGQG